MDEKSQSVVGDDEPFSVWGLNSERMEDGCLVSWREELEDGTRQIKIVVRTEEEFAKAVERFSRSVKKTWPLL